MLEQNFQTSQELGIDEPVRQALIKTLAMLEQGRLSHIPVENWEEEEGDDENPINKGFTGHFNMGTWREVFSCGTVCCIGGTAELIGNIQIDGHETKHLFRLFHPRHQEIGAMDYDIITPAQAAMALRSYLTTGDSRWDLAVSDSSVE